MKKHKIKGMTALYKGREVSRRCWMRCSCPSCCELFHTLQRKYKLKKRMIAPVAELEQ